MFTKLFTMAAAAAVATSPAWPTPCPEFVYQDGWSVDTSAEVQWDGVFHEHVGFFKSGAQNGDRITVQVASGNPLPGAGAAFSGGSYASSDGDYITVEISDLPDDQSCAVTGNMNFWWDPIDEEEGGGVVPSAAEDYYDVSSCVPTTAPDPEPTTEPSEEPTVEPVDPGTEEPSEEPSQPSVEPTDEASEVPSEEPSEEASEPADDPTAKTETETQPETVAPQPEEEYTEPESTKSEQPLVESETESEAQTNDTPDQSGPSSQAPAVQQRHATQEHSTPAPANRGVSRLAHTGSGVEAVAGAAALLTILGLGVLTYAIDRKDDK